MSKSWRNFFFLSSLILPLMPELCLAAPEVIVIRAEKAVIYADQERKIPIGTLSRGKIIKVAEQALQVDSLYAIAISGRLAYVPAEDVYEPIDVQEEWFRRYYISKNLDQAYLYRRWNREQSLSFSSGPLAMGSDLPGLAAAHGGEVSPSEVAWPFQGTFSWRIDQDYGFDLGGQYSYYNSALVKLHLLTVLGAINLYLFDTHSSSLIWSNALLLSPWGQFNTGDQQSTMAAYGAQSSLRWNWRWERLWGPFVEGLYRYQRVSGLASDYPQSGNLEWQGPGLLAGLFFAWD